MTDERPIVPDKIIRNQKEAWAHVVRLCADILGGSVGEEWCGNDDEASERRLRKAQRRLIDELERRADRLEKNLAQKK